MLGGGSVAGKIDVDQPFRPSSIRGALRRWWRASTAFESLEQLREAERDLWGMPDEGPNSSKVRIEVECDGRIEPVPLGVKRGRSKYIFADGIPEYLVGFYSESIPGLQLLREGACFEIRIRVRQASAQQRKQLGGALIAWLGLGGIGSRSRRGFGSLEILRSDPAALPGLVSGILTSDVSGGLENPELGITNLRRKRILFGPPCGGRAQGPEGAMKAWRQAAEAMRVFRHGEGREGRSPWPEADSLRVRQGGKPLWEDWTEERYPRAEFGLPMSVHSADRSDFKDDDLTFLLEQRDGDEKRSRLPSPILLKPVKVDGDWRAAIIWLGTKPLSSPSANTNAEDTPYTGRRGRPNVLDAFWDFLADGKDTKVGKWSPKP